MIKDVFLDFLFPQDLTCLICDKELVDEHVTNTENQNVNNRQLTSPLCQACASQLEKIGDRACSKCGKPIENVFSSHHAYHYQCKACQEQFYYFEKNFAVYSYEGIAKKMVLDYKYKHKHYLNPFMASQMAELLRDKAEVDYIMPVPIHFTRRLSRGFNQSEELAKMIDKELGQKQYLNGLMRPKMTPKLKKLGKDSRKQILKNAIMLKSAYLGTIKGKNIVLIDDIFTTGSTLNTCAKVLYEAGANCIYGLTFTAKNDANNK